MVDIDQCAQLRVQLLLNCRVTALLRDLQGFLHLSEFYRIVNRTPQRMLSHIHLALEADHIKQSLKVVFIHVVEVAALDHRPSIHSLDHLSYRDALLYALPVGQ